MNIPISKASITEVEIRWALEAVTNGWGTRGNEYIARFEQRFKDHVGAAHAIATSSATGALHMGLAALGVGPGDEVLLADINWIATLAPIRYLGAIPIFTEVDPRSLCMDPEDAAKKITPRTKAIVVTHLYGNLCDMNRLLELGETHGIPIIEDAAEAMGSYFFQRHAGTMGHFGVFSFHGSKTMTTGEGGMLITQDENLYERVLMLSHHGRSKDETRQFYPAAIGFKYKTTNMAAAIGIGQLERIDQLLTKRREVFEYYRDGLKDFALEMNPEPQGCINGLWMPTFVVGEHSNFNRELLIRQAKARGVDLRSVFWPLSGLDCVQAQNTTEKAFALSLRGVNLPSYFDITHSEMDTVIGTVADGLHDQGIR